MSGFPCGNNPHHHLTPGDRAAIAQFHAYLLARAEEKKTVNDLESARAALRPFEIITGFVDDLRRFEAAARANERASAEARRLGAPDSVPTTPAVDRDTVLRVAADFVFALDFDQLRDGYEFDSHRQAWEIGTIDAAAELRRLAAEEPTK